MVEYGLASAVPTSGLCAHLGQAVHEVIGRYHPLGYLIPIVPPQLIRRAVSGGLVVIKVPLESCRVLLLDAGSDEVLHLGVHLGALGVEVLQ